MEYQVCCHEHSDFYGEVSFLLDKNKGACTVASTRQHVNG